MIQDQSESNSERGKDKNVYLSEEAGLTPLLAMTQSFEDCDWLVVQEGSKSAFKSRVYSKGSFKTPSRYTSQENLKFAVRMSGSERSFHPIVLTREFLVKTKLRAVTVADFYHRGGNGPTTTGGAVL